MNKINLTNLFERIKIGDKISVFRRTIMASGIMYEGTREATVIYKGERFICVEYIPEDIVGKKGVYRECFDVRDFGRSKVKLIEKVS